ncbi:hypothetical protein CathTA2_0572 [Caldalkalibacillus thermarum TA2.A1]|uniref:Uncharacterized protein n=1 Tax=Caldalkalibacillus thermarum (strain TA2.A1) TaxID=986075 RepID=F5L460_CALTT|nr:hypothetical protein [Caldalkalibacillus thermarum]EGL83870.1 hypothetical protein CathTA2_0572 [Caldalkalibacillus thermarum TA2.A1]QZT34728.1 hypothetical protein HUR95_05335 [Caldalkalibacillus thermarum TA2.A1]
MSKKEKTAIPNLQTANFSPGENTYLTEIGQNGETYKALYWKEGKSATADTAADRPGDEDQPRVEQKGVANPGKEYDTYKVAEEYGRKSLDEHLK